LVGRPSWLSTIKPVAKPSSGIAVAKYKTGFTGKRVSSGWRTYGRDVFFRLARAGRQASEAQNERAHEF